MSQSQHADEFRNYTRMVKQHVMSAFAQGIQIQIPSNDMTLEEIINVNEFARLEDFIDQYHVPYGGDAPLNRSGKTLPPLHHDAFPSIEGLLGYLKKHWIPNLLEQTTSGIELTLNIENKEDSVSFSLGMKLTPEAFESVEGQMSNEDLLNNLNREFDSRK